MRSLGQITKNKCCMKVLCAWHEGFTPNAHIYLSHVSGETAAGSIVAHRKVFSSNLHLVLWSNRDQISVDPNCSAVHLEAHWDSSKGFGFTSAQTNSTKKEKSRTESSEHLRCEHSLKAVMLFQSSVSCDPGWSVNLTLQCVSVPEGFSASWKGF